VGVKRALSTLILILLLPTSCSFERRVNIPTVLHPAYAVQPRPGALIVIDIDAQQIIGKIPLKELPAPAIAVAPNGKVYVPIEGGLGVGSNIVTVYDPKTRIVKNISVGRIPYDLTITPEGKAYVLNQEGGHHGTISIIDTQTDRVIKTVDVGLMPWAVTASPDGHWVYVTREDPGYIPGKPFMFDPNPRSDEPEPAPATIAVIDTQKDEVVRIVGLREGSAPQALAYAYKKLYIALTSARIDPDPMDTKRAPGKAVIVLDPKSFKVIKRIPVPANPWRMALAPNGKLYVGHRYLGYEGDDYRKLTVIDTRSDQVIKIIDVGGEVEGLGMANSTRLYVSPSIIIDTTTDEIIGRFPESLYFRSIASY